MSINIKTNKVSIKERILEAGVVGAGGAGFPAHVKAVSTPEFVIANGAECEPLIHKDYELMVHFPQEIIKGMSLMLKATSAKKGFIGVKTKNAEAIDSLNKHIQDSGLQLFELGDFYPSGDEYELVYSITKRLIPPAGIPLDVGCVVNNVETLYNIAKADEGEPVTQKFISIAGAVKNPCSFFATVGSSFRDVIEFAGGATVKDYGIFIGGIMMGKLTFDLDDVITKTTAGLIILPKEHYLIKRKNQPPANWHRIGKSACDQCSYCTEFCPRFLLGYDVQPHKVMRSLSFTKTGAQVWNQNAELCCACGLCTLYACPEDLYPKEACDEAKFEMKKEGIKFVQSKPVKVHPIKEGRRVPLSQLIKRLNVQNYDVHTPYREGFTGKWGVKILLKQHIGVPAVPVHNIGDFVEKGVMIAKVPEGKLGSTVHASIKGRITQITDEYIRINRE